MMNQSGDSKGLCKEKKFPKSEITMEAGGWVQVSFEFFFNHPKIAPTSTDILE